MLTLVNMDRECAGVHYTVLKLIKKKKKEDFTPVNGSWKKKNESFYLLLQPLLVKYFFFSSICFEGLQCTDKCLFNVEDSALDVLSAIDGLS